MIGIVQQFEPSADIGKPYPSVCAPFLLFGRFGVDTDKGEALLLHFEIKVYVRKLLIIVVMLYGILHKGNEQ